MTQILIVLAQHQNQPQSFVCCYVSCVRLRVCAFETTKTSLCNSHSIAKCQWIEIPWEVNCWSFFIPSVNLFIPSENLHQIWRLFHWVSTWEKESESVLQLANGCLCKEKESEAKTLCLHSGDQTWVVFWVCGLYGWAEAVKEYTDFIPTTNPLHPVYVCVYVCVTQWPCSKLV